MSVLHSIPRTLAEVDELIVRVSTCQHEAVRFHEVAIDCSCSAKLGELYAIRAKLLEAQIPAQPGGQ